MNTKKFTDEMLSTLDNRGSEYGDTKKSFEMIATMWSEYLDTTVSSQDVCNMMILLKMSRLAENTTHHDSYIDIAGYAAISDMLGKE